MALARSPDSSPIGNLELTKMRRRHLRRVLAIESRVYPRPWSMSLFLSELAQRSSRSYLVAKYEGDVIAYAGMMFTGKEAHVTNIAVDPDYQGRKVGSRLLLTVITEAIARGARKISLEVRVTNDAAQEMYRKFGFSTVGIRRGYYIETNEDALVMVADETLSTDYRVLMDGIRKELDRIGGGGR
jgi:ribosomal-protein-alanine N-acetyltransferase